AGLEISMGQNQVTPADYQRWRTEYKNWGRWGADDQKGTRNLITPQKVLTAARLVKNGIVVSLAHAEPQKAEADVPAAGVFHRTTNAISATNTTDTGELSRSQRGAHGFLLPLFLRRQNVQRVFSEGEHHQ